MLSEPVECVLCGAAECVTEAGSGTRLAAMTAYVVD